MLELSARETRAFTGGTRLAPVELHDACPYRIESIAPHLNAPVAHGVARSRGKAVRAGDAVRRGGALGALPPASAHSLKPTVEEPTHSPGVPGRHAVAQ